jgi:hypothetical protein
VLLARGSVFHSELSRGILVFAESFLAIAAPVLTQTLRVEEITCLGHLDWIEISQNGETHAERSLIDSGDVSVTAAQREEWRQSCCRLLSASLMGHLTMARN